MPETNSSFSTSHAAIEFFDTNTSPSFETPIRDNIEEFIAAYPNASPAEKESLFAKLKSTWTIPIHAIQFGQLISCMEYAHIAECYRLAKSADQFFLKNAHQFTQICAHLDPERIIFFCELIEQRLHTPHFIDNATAFSAIFTAYSISLPDDKKRQIQLNTQQLLTVYNILRPKLNTHGFVRTLDDFINLFLLIPTIEDKVMLFETIRNQLHKLVTEKNEVNDIHQKLKPSNAAESELFKQIREEIFRAIICDRTRLDKAFYAMLFLILDNYPGNQPEKLKSIIETTFSDPSIKELDKLLEKTENAMRFLECNITSTRLQNALIHLIANLRTKEKKIDVDHIIQLAKSKEPVLSISFFREPKEIEIHITTQATTCQHEF